MSSAEGKTIEPATLDISVKRSELLRELSIAQGVVERKSTIPVLSHFLFETSGPNLLITATDTEVGLRTFCPATVRQPGSCTIPARKLFDYVRLLTDGDMTLKALDHGWAQIRSGRSVTKMVGLPRDSFPKLPLYPAGSAVRVSAPTFRAMITRTLFAVSQEEGKYALYGVLLILQPTTISMVATDGNRLAHVEAPASVTGLKEDIRVLIPTKALSQLGMLLSSGTVEAFEFAKNDSSLFFRIGGRLLTCRQLLGNFPNYEPMPRLQRLSCGSL
jgi:DNA polymerase-3 subunit beta